MVVQLFILFKYSPSIFLPCVVKKQPVLTLKVLKGYPLTVRDDAGTEGASMEMHLMCDGGLFIRCMPSFHNRKEKKKYFEFKYVL